MIELQSSALSRQRRDTFYPNIHRVSDSGPQRILDLRPTRVTSCRFRELALRHQSTPTSARADPPFH